jgi:hypothetical protein
VADSKGALFAMLETAGGDSVDTVLVSRYRVEHHRKHRRLVNEKISTSRKSAAFGGRICQSARL